MIIVCAGQIRPGAGLVHRIEKTMSVEAFDLLNLPISTGIKILHNDEAHAGLSHHYLRRFRVVAV